MRPPRRECSAHWDSANVFCCSAGTAATSASGVCAKTLGTGLRTTLVYHKVLEEFLHDDHLLILRKGLKAAAIWQRAASALRQRVDRTLLYSREVNRVFTLAVWVPPWVVPRQGAGGCSRVFFSFPNSATPQGSPSPPRFSNLYGTPYGISGGADGSGGPSGHALRDADVGTRVPSPTMVTHCLWQCQ